MHYAPYSVAREKVAGIDFVGHIGQAVLRAVGEYGV